MTQEKKEAEKGIEGQKPAPRCMQCGSSSEVRVLLPCLHQGESLWVCVRCLPMLIHGMH
jgi:hypothetical protein